MSKVLARTITLWIVLFAAVSFFHSYQFHLEINAIPGFYSTFSDVIIIGFILTFVSLASTFLLFFWLVRIIKRSDRSTRNLIQVNAIIIIASVIAFFITAEIAASWWEGVYYVGIYGASFLLLLNIYFQKETRTC